MHVYCVNYFKNNKLNSFIISYLSMRSPPGITQPFIIALGPKCFLAKDNFVSHSFNDILWQ